MSPNVGNFVHDLVEMAKAMETLPQVEHERDELKTKLDDAQGHSQALELRIIDYKEQVERLLAKVRATEAERDDAELRFLELEDKSVNILAMAKAARVSLDQMTGMLDPPKPQPEPAVEVAPENDPMGENDPRSPYYNPPVPDAVQSIEPQPQGQGEGPPTSEASIGTTFQTEPSPTSQDQSEVNPTTASESLTSGLETQPSSGNTQSESVEASNPFGPYTDKRYFYHAGYVPFSEWIRGGGTEADYNWRPVSNNDF